MSASYLKYLHRVSQFINTKPIQPTFEYSIGHKDRLFGVCEYGVPKDQARHTLLYFHGTPACRLEPCLHSDVSMENIYQNHKVRLICIERPGFGISPLARVPYSVDDFATDVLQLESELSLPRKFSALGFSAGAPYVWALKSKASHRIEAAIVVAGVVSPEITNYQLSTRKSIESLFFGLPLSMQTFFFGVGIELIKLELKTLSLIFQVLRRLGAKSFDSAKLDAIVSILDESSRQGYQGVTQDTIRNQAAPWGFDLSHAIDNRVYLYYSLEDWTVAPSEARLLSNHTGLEIRWIEGGHLCLYLNLKDIVESSLLRN